MLIKDFDPERESSYELEVPDKIIDELANTFTRFNTTRYFVSHPYITFELDKKDFSLRILMDGGEVEIVMVTAIFNHFGLDIIVQTAGKNILVFNAFGVDKGVKFNMDFFRRFVNKKRKESREVKNIEIAYTESCDLEINGNKYNRCLIKVFVESSLSRELLEFYELFQKLDISTLQKYKNLRIYLNKPKELIDDNILFDIENCDDVDKFRLNFIDNRLFFIDNEKRLIANNFYFSTSSENKLKCSINGTLMKFDKDEMVIKTPECVVM